VVSTAQVTQVAMSLPTCLWNLREGSVPLAGEALVSETALAGEPGGCFVVCTNQLFCKSLFVFLAGYFVGIPFI